MNNPQKRLIRYLFGLDDVAAGAIIGGSISAASAAGGVAAQARMNKVNRQWQERMWRKTNIRQEEMYNWYNSPQAKARQMIAAGLNPAAQSTTSGTASSTNSVPTPATSPLPFDAMAHAGDVVANSLQARAQLKHQKAVLAQQALEQARRFALDELATLTDVEQKKAQTALFLKQIEVADIDKETKGFIRDMLEEFVNNGGNTYFDSHSHTTALVQKIAHDIEYDKKRFNLELARYNLDVDRFNRDKEISEEQIKALARDNEFADAVQNYFDIDYRALPDYLKTMVTGVVLGRKNLYSWQWNSTEDYNNYEKRVKQLETQFITAYDDYLTNTADALSLSAGKISESQVLGSIIQLLKN